jgi:xanthine dehydrogenase iron-sulfur cluster and FAD-binding subunit A
VTQFSANSCLTLIYSLNFCSVITTEGLGNARDGFHSIQKRMAGFHASQCGFCTPGMCMSIFSSLVAADNSKGQKPTDGFSKLTVSEAENAFSGNLCRCTGYRPIVDACKSFASDVDLEDLGLNIFWKKGDKKPDTSKLPSYTHGGGICIFPDFLISEIKSLQDQQNDANITVSKEKWYHHTLSSSNFCGGIFSFLDCLKYGSNSLQNHPIETKITVSKAGWYHPTSIKEYSKLINSFESSESSVKVVVGNTSAGVYKDQDIYNKYINIGGIQELSSIIKKVRGVEIGAATTISRTIEILVQESKTVSSLNGSVVFRKLAEHMSKVASPFVRNTASLGGNIVLAQKYQFPSDIATILLGAGSTVCLQDVGQLRHITLEEFLQQPPLNPTTLLISIFIPHWVSDSQKEVSLVFQTFRAASRPHGNAVSYVNSAFLGHVCFDKLSGELALSNLHLAFGAYGTEHAIRARKVEKFLIGKSLTASSVLEAIQLLRKTIVPMKGTLHAEYRVSVTVGFLFSFLSPLARGMAVPRISEFPLSSRQETVSDDEYKPIGEPTKKYGVELQASGNFTILHLIIHL